MKKALLSFLTGTALLLTTIVSAQNVAINTTGATADPSAILDISATNAGLLAPRVTLSSLTDAATIANPATSLLVYNTGGAVTAGFYYNSGTPASPAWSKFSTGGNYWASADGVNIYNTNTGEVNIGANTTLTNGQLNVYGSVAGTYGVTYYQTPGTGTGPYVGFAIGEDNLSDNSVDLFNFGNGPINFLTNGAEAAIIAANGNIGIGRFTPLAKTEISSFGPVNNLYTTPSGFPLITGLAVYENDSVTTSTKEGIYSFVDGDSIENIGVFGEAGSTALSGNIGVLGRVSFPPANPNTVSGAIWGYDAVGTVTPTTNTFAGYFIGKVDVLGNTSVFGSSPAIDPSATWIGFDASTYSTNTSTDDSVSTTGVLGYASGGTGTFNSGVVGIGGSTGSFNAGAVALAGDGPDGTNIGLFAQANLHPGDYAAYLLGNVLTYGNTTTYGSSPAITPSASFIGFDAATYSSNLSVDDSVSEVGVLGYTNGGTAGFGAGVVGIGGSTNTFNAGLIGLADDGAAGTNFALFAEADNASDYAGYFNGNVFISGTLSASGTKNFEIDHPLDPANKILRHAAMESNEVLDQYSGNITTDGTGYATVQLPAYFESITKDFRYQLTVIGTFAQAIVKQKVSGNQFVIQTNQPNVEVSWQVTGVRNDKQMQAHPFVAEEAKTARQAGKYFQPELYGQPASAGIAYMPKSNGRTAVRKATPPAIPSLKAIAGAAHKSANSIKPPVVKGIAGSVAVSGGLKKPTVNKNAAPVYPANSLLGKAQQAKAAKAGNASTPKK